MTGEGTPTNSNSDTPAQPGVFLSVIVPTFNRLESLSTCLKALAPGVQIYAPSRYEVIVSDDANTAREALSSRFPYSSWNAGPRRGPAANRNAGAARARGSWLVFLDDDCVPDPTYLASFAEASANHPECLIFEGRTYADRPVASLADTAPINETGGVLWSCNLCVSNDLFGRLGGFNESFPHACLEDVDFRERIKKAGHHSLFVPRAAVCHAWRSIAPRTFMRRYQESIPIYLAQHPDHRHLLSRSSQLRELVRMFVRETLPGIVKYRGKGLGNRLLYHWYHLRLTVGRRIGARRSGGEPHPLVSASDPKLPTL